MGFSGIGIWEILLILIVAFIVLGPRRVPEIARKLGQTVRAIKKASTDLTTTLSKELEVKENEPPPPQSEKESSAETRKEPPAISQASPQDQDDQPTKPGGAPAAK